MKPMETQLRELVLRNIPETVAVTKDDDVTVDNIGTTLAWGNATEKPLGKKAGWIVTLGTPVPQHIVADGAKDRNDVTEQILDETHDYSAGDTHTVLEERDVDSITSVTAAVGGVQTPLVEDVDWELVDEDGDGMLDALRWLSGGQKPDVGLDTVTVTYDHLLLESERRQLVRQRILVTAVAQPHKTGEFGATQVYDPQQIVEAMRRSLLVLFEATLRPQLEAAGFAIRFDLEADGSFRFEDSLELHYPHQFMVDYDEVVPTERVRGVGKVTTSATIT